MYCYASKCPRKTWGKFIYRLDYVHLNIASKQHRQIAGNSCYVISTVLGSKDLPSNTLGKLKGMVRI